MDEKAAFEAWRKAEGDAIAEEIRERIKANSAVLNVNEGSHAVWHEGRLGMLLVLPFEHAMAFSAEAVAGDYDNSPLHNYVFATISELIMRATAVMNTDEVD